MRRTSGCTVFSSEHNKQYVYSKVVVGRIERLKRQSNPFIVSFRRYEFEAFGDAIHMSIHGQNWLVCGEEENNISCLGANSRKSHEQFAYLVKGR